jgi:peptide chain release factor 3
VQLAGSVTARKNQRATTSDWMELEKQRGISVSSTVLQFEYRGSSSTCSTPPATRTSPRTPTACSPPSTPPSWSSTPARASSPDPQALRGLPPRGIPIFTFMNKLDRPARDPLELLDELERVLGITPPPMNWPLGTGRDFRGVYDRRTRRCTSSSAPPGGAYRAR